MTPGSDPRGRARSSSMRGRMDGPPGWADALFAGRSRADKEADQDAFLRAIVVIGGVLVLLLVGLHALFTAVGLQLGWWSVPVFVPLFVWLLVSAAMRGGLRPVELEELRWRQRLEGAGVLLVVLWVLWPLWAGPAAGAWTAAHGGFHGIASDGPRYPLGAVLGASPVAMGIVAFVLLAVGMMLAPRQLAREAPHQSPGRDRPDHRDHHQHRSEGLRPPRRERVPHQNQSHPRTTRRRTDQTRRLPSRMELHHHPVT
jgi:hypothetical protein